MRTANHNKGHCLERAQSRDDSTLPRTPRPAQVGVPIGTLVSAGRTALFSWLASSLIELLALIAITAVLAPLLLPALPWPAPIGTNTRVSPKRLTDDPSLVLVSEMNDWSPGYGQTFAPHGKNGTILMGGDYSNADASGASSAEIGAVGGNVGLLDGSVAWKGVAQMRIYRGSQKWGNDGCWAMW